MRPVSPPGEMILTARAATPREFRPYGRLLGAGTTLRLGPARRTILAVHSAQPMARRVTHLVRFPKARRAVHVIGSSSAMWLVTLAPGERPGGAPVAFLLPPEQVVVLERGVWHAGPFPLKPATICEVIEAPGQGHHVDQGALAELAGVEAVAVVLPDEPQGTVPRFELDAPHAVLFDSQMGAHWRMGLALVEGVQVAAMDGRVAEQLNALATERIEQWPLGVLACEREPARTLREHLAGSGAQVERAPVTLERLYTQALAGRPLLARDPLRCLGRLLALRRGLPVSLLDADHMGEGVHARLGASGERLERRGAGRLPLVGVPLLADRHGALATPCGDAWRAEAGPTTRRVLAVLFFPGLHDPAFGRQQLDDALAELVAQAGGRVAGRLLLGWPLG